MSLFLRGNVWWMELRKNGKPFRESCRTNDREVAERVHSIRKAELVLSAAGAHPALRKESKTWDDAASRWLDESQHKRDLRGDIAKLKWLRQHLGGKRLADLTRDDYVDAIRLKARETTPQTGNRYMALIRAILRRAAHEWQWIDKVPTFRQAKEPPGRQRYLQPEEIDRLLSELPEHQRLMAGFAFAVGQRQAAIKSLTWDRVNLEKGFCWIDVATSKSGKPIPVPLNAAARAILEKCMGKHERYVFTYNGGPVSQVNTRAWRKALKRAGITDFRWHDTRHTWASHHAMNGTPLHVIKELGGWADMKMPLRYAHFSVDALKAYSENAPRQQLAAQSCAHNAVQ